MHSIPCRTARQPEICGSLPFTSGFRWTILAPGSHFTTIGSIMAERAGDWIAQAHRDVENARHSRNGGFFEWASFAAQQSAERGLKAVYQALGADAWGHSVFRLLQGLAERIEVPEALLLRGRELDRYYIPARYPNGWGAGAPKDLILEEDAEHAIGAAEEILRFCDRLLAGP